MTASASLEHGRVYEVPYPFILAESQWNADDSGAFLMEWRPGTKPYEGPEDADLGADGMGSVLYTVVSTHKPFRYPERVFYVRQWRDPRGTLFGKRALRCTTVGNFRRMLNGFRYRFTMQQQASAVSA